MSRKLTHCHRDSISIICAVNVCCHVKHVICCNSVSSDVILKSIDTRQTTTIIFLKKLKVIITNVQYVNNLNETW